MKPGRIEIWKEHRALVAMAVSDWSEVEMLRMTGIPFMTLKLHFRLVVYVLWFAVPY